MLSVVLVGVATPAAADWHVMPSIGLTFGGDTSLFDADQATGLRKQTYGGTVQWLGDGLLGFEGDFGYAPGFFERDATVPSLILDSSLMTLTGNVVVAIPKRITGYSLRPYISGGGGLIRARALDVLDLLPVDSNLFGIDVGGGAIGLFTDRIGVRWDVRYFRNIKRPSEDDPNSLGLTRISFWRVNLSLVLRY